jgi:hypothetical protein
MPQQCITSSESKSQIKYHACRNMILVNFESTSIQFFAAVNIRGMYVSKYFEHVTSENVLFRCLGREPTYLA